MQDFFQKITDYFRLCHSTVIGVYGTKNTAYIVCLKREKNTWRLWEKQRIALVDRNELAAKVRLTATKGGCDNAPVSLYIDEENLVTTTGNFKNVEPSEMPESVHWEIHGLKIFAEREFLTIYAPMPDLADYFWIAALEVVKVTAIKREWEENDLSLYGLTSSSTEEELPAADDGWWFRRDTAIMLGDFELNSEEYEWRKALLAASTLTNPGNENFFPNIPMVNQKRVVGFCLTILIGCLLILSCFDYYRLVSMREEAQHTQAALALLESEERQKKEIDALWAAYNGKSKILRELSQSRLPWRGLLTHLATLPMEGVCLTELELTEEGILDMRGYALNYHLLANYLAVLEEKVSSAATIEDTVLTAEEEKINWEKINFRVRLKLEPGQ